MQFIMIGSGNPQEGELRPQLLDRFGLSVNVATLQDTDTRVELVMSRMQYEEDPDKFCASVEAEQQALRDKLVAATSRLQNVAISTDTKLKISEICSLLEVDGIRGDMVVNRAAKALVALEDRPEVTLDDVARPHRAVPQPQDAEGSTGPY
jgi:Mg-chelatase subunit ChlI